MHICVFGYVAHAMRLDEKRGRINVNDTNCLFLGYCEGTKAYKLICLQTF